MTQYVSENGAHLTLLPETCRSGGRSEVFDVVEAPNVVVKILKPGYRTPDREKKVAQAIADLAHIKGVAHILERLYDETGAFVGYVMDKIEGQTLHQLLRIKKLTLSNRVELGLELAKVVRRLHECNYPIIVGDLDLRNVMVDKSGTVFLVDVDSFQLIGQDGRILPVQEAHCKSPEMLQDTFDEKTFSEKSDSFLLGYSLFWLTYMSDPFIDPLSSFDDEDQRSCERTDNIKAGVFAYRQSKAALPDTLVGFQMARLFMECFSQTRIPPVREWVVALKNLLTDQFTCCPECDWEVPNSVPMCPCCGNLLNSFHPMSSDAKKVRSSAATRSHASTTAKKQHEKHWLLVLLAVAAAFLCFGFGLLSSDGVLSVVSAPVACVYWVGDAVANIIDALADGVFRANSVVGATVVTAICLLLFYIVGRVRDVPFMRFVAVCGAVCYALYMAVPWVSAIV